MGQRFYESTAPRIAKGLEELVGILKANYNLEVDKKVEADIASDPHGVMASLDKLAARSAPTVAAEALADRVLGARVDPDKTFTLEVNAKEFHAIHELIDISADFDIEQKRALGYFDMDMTALYDRLTAIWKSGEEPEELIDDVMRAKLKASGKSWAEDNVERCQNNGVGQAVCFDLARAALGQRFGSPMGKREQLQAEAGTDIVKTAIANAVADLEKY